MRNLQKNPRLRALQLVRTMIEYRNAEISTLSRNLKRGIIHMHRERSMKKHAEQFKELKEYYRPDFPQYR